MTCAFAISSDEAFLPFSAVVARRIADLAAPSKPAVFILGDRLSDDGVRMAREYVGDALRVVEIANLLDGLDVPVSRRITRATYGPLLLDMIAPLDGFDRCLAIDSDVLPLSDLTAIGEVRLGASALAACHDFRSTTNGGFHQRLGMPPGSPYFNAGVLYFDLERIREGGQLEAARRFASENAAACLLNDQDALNHVFANAWQALDWRWNFQADFMATRLPQDDIRIVHFTGTKPWNRPNDYLPVRYSELYVRMLADSPWGERFKPRYGAADLLRRRYGVAVRDVRDRVRRLAAAGLNDREGGRFVRRGNLARNAEAVRARIEREAAAGAIASGLDDLTG